jgi:hypothetical protein
MRNEPVITLQLSENDFLNGSLFAARWTMKRWLVIGVQALLLSALGAFMLLSSSSRDFHVFGGALIGMVVGGFAGGVLMRYLVLPARLRTRFAERTALHRQSTLKWSQEGLAYENENGHMLVPWTDFFKTRENKDFILLYTSRVMFIIVPKRFFTESGQLQGFVELVRSRIGNRLDGQAVDSATRPG